MHLILGHPDDACCAGVLAGLRARGLAARLVTEPLASPARLAWRLDDEGVDSRFAPDGSRRETISSVLVRDAGWLDPAGWQPADYAYMQAETHAALLAWLASLPCPVINRPSAGFWYRPRMPLLSWRPLLRHVGLPSPDTLVTNDAAVARDFVRALEREGAGGAVCTPLTGGSAWLVTDADSRGVAALQALGPVCLSEPHGPVQSACIVGDRVVWNGTPAADVADLAPRLLRLAEAADLASLEIAIAPVRRGQAVVLVEPLVQLEHFHGPARDGILNALVDLLTGEVTCARQALETPA